MVGNAVVVTRIEARQDFDTYFDVTDTKAVCSKAVLANRKGRI